MVTPGSENVEHAFPENRHPDELEQPVGHFSGSPLQSDDNMIQNARRERNRQEKKDEWKHAASGCLHPVTADKCSCADDEESEDPDGENVLCSDMRRKRSDHEQGYSSQRERESSPGGIPRVGKDGFSPHPYESETDKRNRKRGSIAVILEAETDQCLQRGTKHNERDDAGTQK